MMWLNLGGSCHKHPEQRLLLRDGCDWARPARPPTFSHRTNRPLQPAAEFNVDVAIVYGKNKEGIRKTRCKRSNEKNLSLSCCSCLTDTLASVGRHLGSEDALARSCRVSPRLAAEGAVREVEVEVECVLSSNTSKLSEWILRRKIIKL